MAKSFQNGPIWSHWLQLTASSTDKQELEFSVKGKLREALFYSFHLIFYSVTRWLNHFKIFAFYENENLPKSITFCLSMIKAQKHNILLKHDKNIVKCKINYQSIAQDF